MNLLSGSSLHQKIISVGRDSIIEEEARKTSSYSRLHSQLSSSRGDLRGGQDRQHRHRSREEFGAEERQALTFSVRQRMISVEGGGGGGGAEASGASSLAGTPVRPDHHPFPKVPPLHAVHSRPEVEVEVRMASVVYVHSASFLEELNNCAADFKQLMASLAQHIKTAATEIALGIVTR